MEAGREWTQQGQYTDGAMEDVVGDSRAVMQAARQCQRDLHVPTGRIQLTGTSLEAEQSACISLSSSQNCCSSYLCLF